MLGTNGYNYISGTEFGKIRESKLEKGPKRAGHPKRGQNIYDL
jgi:hypothetical protein